MTARELPIKIVYTINPSPHPIVARYKRVPTTVISLPDALNAASNVEYGKVRLRDCLHAVCQASPELIADQKRDYTVYVLDPLEQAETPFASSSKTEPKMSPTWGAPVGMGLMSWCLSSDGDDDAEPVFVLGKLITHPISGQMVEVYVSLQETRAQTQQKHNDQLNSWGTPAASKAPSRQNSAQPPTKRPLPTPRSTSSPAPVSAQEVVDLTGDDPSNVKAVSRAKKKPADTKKPATTSTPANALARSRSSTLPQGQPPGPVPYPYAAPQPVPSAYQWYWAQQAGAPPQPGMVPYPMPPFPHNFYPPSSDAPGPEHPPPPVRAPPKSGLATPAASSSTAKPAPKPKQQTKPPPPRPAVPPPDQKQGTFSSAKRPSLPVSRTKSLPAPATSSATALALPAPSPAPTHTPAPSDTPAPSAGKENVSPEASTSTSGEKKRRLSASAEENAEEHPRKKLNSDDNADGTDAIPTTNDLASAPTTPRVAAKQLMPDAALESSPLFSPGVSSSAALSTNNIPVTPARSTSASHRIFGSASANELLASLLASSPLQWSDGAAAAFSPLRNTPGTQSRLADLFSSSPIARAPTASLQALGLGLPPSSPLPPTSSPTRDENEDEDNERADASPATADNIDQAMDSDTAFKFGDLGFLNGLSFAGAELEDTAEMWNVLGPFIKQEGQSTSSDASTPMEHDAAPAETAVA
ncbi:hypothetical protein EXIGLDRAFT_829048 [Exidia glandulosa HHB12029]|uniref:Ams2/SPT21 N-terminal domain-containing protein n=1 Tax=Exidia glandulosa HHB12029 TaxID=1314781 RepID=A0A165Q0V0_EXIGL|nr:hypothetical protein EXIGLDRAFT_829048 [Exidia glandulosa HHB12029]